MAAGVIAVAVAVTSLALWAPDLARGIAIEAVTVPFRVLGLDDSRMPPGLLVYDQAQPDRFRQGIVRFSDEELLEFARTTQHDLGAGGAMAAAAHDSLLLTRREIGRRGLPLPLTTLRDAFLRP